MEEQSNSPRAALHYLAAATLLAVYGVLVCPFLESLSPLQLASPIFAAFGLQYLIRRPAVALATRDVRYRDRMMRVFAVEYGLFLIFGIVLAAFNAAVYGFPVGSGMKIVVGMAAFGFFAAIDLTLEWQRNLLVFFYRTGRQMHVDDNYVPLSGKFGAFASATVLFILAVMFLVINKDLDWLKDVGDTIPLAEAQLSILAEVSFIIGIILIYVINVIVSYARNLRSFFDTENGVLQRATHGELDGFVPVGTNDEFGIMAVHTNKMIQGLRESTEEVRRTRDVSILTLASLAETRDNETGAHILRTQRYVKTLAESLKGHSRFSELLTEENIDLLYKSAPLHDIGKVGIPDNILLKPGELTADEFEIMKNHPALGAQALAVAEGTLGSNSFLHFAREIALTHHEKWDGSGYPAGLRGDAIPISGRLMALADVYDALISKRVYKPAFSHEKARGLIVEGRGSHFDADVVDAFLAAEAAFRAIAREFSDQAYSERAGAQEPESEPKAGTGTAG